MTNLLSVLTTIFLKHGTTCEHFKIFFLRRQYYFLIYNTYLFAHHSAKKCIIQNKYQYQYQRHKLECVQLIILLTDQICYCRKVLTQFHASHKNKSKYLKTYAHGLNVNLMNSYKKNQPPFRTLPVPVA